MLTEACPMRQYLCSMRRLGKQLGQIDGLRSQKKRFRCMAGGYGRARKTS
jgi:hypothetical protein